MDAIARNVTHDVCSYCGEVAGSGAHRYADAPNWRWLRVEYVPAIQSRAAVEALEAIRGVLDHLEPMCPDCAEDAREALDRFGGQ